MYSQIIQGLVAIFDPALIPLIFAGVAFGLTIGVLPGLGGAVVLVLLLPFCYNMQPLPAIILVMSAYSVIYQGGSITAILLNMPGTPPSAATLLDGFPMTQKGKGGRAIGIAQTASAVGGIFGALILALLIPVMRQVVMAFGSAECLVLVFMGITFIAVLTGDSPAKGLVAGGVGLLISLVGYQGISGMTRYSFGSVYLWDGFKIVPMALGLFAIPEAIRLMLTGGTIAKVKTPLSAVTSDIFEGVKDVFRHWHLTLRCSTIGTVVGLTPGVGGGIAAFVAYGHAKQTSKHPERFGTGYEEGVIAPESANDAKEGGSLVPTIAFGIPGSTGMAVLMAILLVVGIVPGPAMLKEHLDLTFTMVGTIVVANIIASSACLLLARQMARIAFVPGHILAPLVLVLVSLGSYSVAKEVLDIVTMFVFGGLGFAMTKFQYSRVAFFIGFILGALAETYLHLSVSAYGWQFFIRPITMALLFITVSTLFYGQIIRLFRRGRKA